MTLRNILPADELALLRTDKQRIERREDELRTGFLAGHLSVQGLAVRVELRQQIRKVFRKDKLPPEILADPRMWEERAIVAVTLVYPSTPGFRSPPRRD